MAREGSGVRPEHCAHGLEYRMVSTDEVPALHPERGARAAPTRRKEKPRAGSLSLGCTLLGLALWCLWGSGIARAAAPTESPDLEALTWTELKSALAHGKTTALVPIGGTEQNGPDIALGKHNARVKVLSDRIAIRLGNAIVAPVMAYVPEGRIDPPEQHMRFPGTLTVSDDTFMHLLESTARSLKLHGFRDIVFIGDHGGYQADERAVAQKLNREWSASDVRVHALEEYYRVTQREYVAELRRRGFGEAEIGTHAGLADASLTLALVPDLVRAERLAGDIPSAALGEYGDPRRASAALGEVGVDLIVEHTVQAIREAVDRHGAGK